MRPLGLVYEGRGTQSSTNWAVCHQSLLGVSVPVSTAALEASSGDRFWQGDRPPSGPF